MLKRPRRLWSGYELVSPVIRRQIEWADHHRDLLNKAYVEFTDRKPYATTEDRREDKGREYRVLTAHPEPAPDEIGHLFADYLNALRSALDYLVGEMRPDGPSRTSAFPIFLQRPNGQRGRFRHRACGALHGVPDEAVKLVHWMQPYHRPGAPERSALRALGAVEVLWNISKHRTLFVVTSAAHPDYVFRERSHDGEDIGFRLRGDRTAEIWLPIADPEESFDPHFAVRASLAQPRGFADDLPDWVEQWELDGLADYFFRAARWEIVPMFNKFMPRAS